MRGRLIRCLQGASHGLAGRRQPSELFDLREGLVQQHLHAADHPAPAALTAAASGVGHGS
ncbi:hypothetical protein MINTMi198_33650 [Mycobacterium intracellulare M.i.198]|nr:hypothetical protein MINTMi198_33650 [Mycobacterium intracellulare M.i.198]